MLRGQVTTRPEARVTIRVRGPRGVRELDAVVDTGYTGVMTLPAAVVADLGLRAVEVGRVTLADGSTQKVDVHTAEVEWGSVWRQINVTVIGSEPLVGMKLLGDHRLTIDVVTNGPVDVTALP